MKLYLMRHGQATSKEEDSMRPLSTEGRKTIQKVSEYVAKFNISISEIAHSNKLRAKETAEIFANSLGLGVKTKEYGGLAPNDDVVSIKNSLRNKKEDMAIVSHLPFLDKLASLLLCGVMDMNIINFRMGEIVCLNGKDNNWTVEWVILPEIIL